MKQIFGLLVSFSVILQSCTGQQNSHNSDKKDLYQQVKQTAHLHSPVLKPGSRDWLKLHKESGQTFQQYRKVSKPVAENQPNIFYIQPIGSFNPTQEEILQLTGKYLSIFYQLPVKFLPTIAISTIPIKAQRKNPHTKQRQNIIYLFAVRCIEKKLPQRCSFSHWIYQRRPLSFG